MKIELHVERVYWDKSHEYRTSGNHLDAAQSLQRQLDKIRTQSYVMFIHTGNTSAIRHTAVRENSVSRLNWGPIKDHPKVP